jgi:hypothetical protein
MHVKSYYQLFFRILTNVDGTTPNDLDYIGPDVLLVLIVTTEICYVGSISVALLFDQELYRLVSRPYVE